jgi:hypothetical protein
MARGAQNNHTGDVDGRIKNNVADDAPRKANVKSESLRCEAYMNEMSEKVRSKISEGLVHTLVCDPSH